MNESSPVNRVDDLSFTWNPPLTDERVQRLSDIWVAATNAGGALGFLPPLTYSKLAPVASRTFARMRDGLDELLVGSVDDGDIGWLLLERDPRDFTAHWRTIKRLQVHPDFQGHGYGMALMEEARSHAHDAMGLDFLVLTVRGGTGTDALYRRLGYREVGHVPSAMRVAAGDDRDEIVMVLSPL